MYERTYVHLYEAGHETFNEIYLKSLLLYRGNFQHANQEWTTIVPYANLHSDCPMGHNMRNGM